MESPSGTTINPEESTTAVISNTRHKGHQLDETKGLCTFLNLAVPVALETEQRNEILY